MLLAWKRVKANKGAAGTDGMSVEQFPEFDISSLPHIGGVVALLREVDPDLDVGTIKEILLAATIDLASPGLDHDSGHGSMPNSRCSWAHQPRYTKARVRQCAHG